MPVPQQESENEFYSSISIDKTDGFWLGIKQRGQGWETDSVSLTGSRSIVTYGVYGNEPLPWRYENAITDQHIYASSFKDNERKTEWYAETESSAISQLNVICTYVCRLYNIY